MTIHSYQIGCPKITSSYKKDLKTETGHFCPIYEYKITRWLYLQPFWDWLMQVESGKGAGRVLLGLAPKPCAFQA